MEIYRFLQKKHIYVKNIQNITTDDFVYKTFIFMSQLLCKQYHMPLESTKPFTIINRPCLRVFIIITLQGGPDAKYKLAVLSVLKQIIRRVIFAMSRAG